MKPFSPPGPRGGRGFGARGGPANYYDGPRGRRGDWGAPRRGRGDFDNGFRGPRFPYNNGRRNVIGYFIMS